MRRSRRREWGGGCRQGAWFGAALLLFGAFAIGCGGDEEGERVSATPGPGVAQPDPVVPEPGDDPDAGAPDAIPEPSEGGDVRDPDAGGEGRDGDDEDADERRDVVEPERPDAREEDATEPEPGPVLDYTDCDAGELAWAKRALEVIQGRRGVSVRELRVLADLAEQTDRATVARGLMHGDVYLDRWRQWFMDELRVNRVGIKRHETCFGAPLAPKDEGEIAAMIRDNPATHQQSNVQFNMSDVVLSSLRLDDLTPMYRAYLFAMMAKPIDGANVGQVEMDITRRQDFGEIFSAIYTNRNVACTGCHNSEWAVTDHPDPAQDRHWQIPGLFEKAVYGASVGRPEMEVYSMFRHLNVVVGQGARPWSMAGSCGRFRASANVPVDPVDVDAYFVAHWGKTANIWQVEHSLHQGVEKLRDGGLHVDPATLEVDPEEAFAYMVAARIADRVWRAAHGYPLTLVHYFPRNQAQRDILMELTNRFVASGFSMRELLVDVVTHPLFNQLAPIDGCEAEGSPYILPMVLNPWTQGVLDPELEPNSVGDGLHRVGARTLLLMLEAALGWPTHAQFHSNEAPEELFQRAVGVFTKDAEPGFDSVDFQGMLAWENRYGACVSPFGAGGGGGGGGGGSPGSCQGYCGGETPSGCWCDELCEGYGDCCADKQAVCDAPPSEAPPVAEVNCDDAQSGDWIDLLVCTAQGTEGATLRDLVGALKDRLVNEVAADEVEAALVADLFGTSSLDDPLEEVAGWQSRVRNFCGVLVQSPHFMLSGLPPRGAEASPHLVVGDTGYEALCTQLAPVILPSVEFSVACEPEGLVVTPAGHAAPPSEAP